MTSIGSPPNAPRAPSAALTTPACEHDESTLTPRPRTRAARNRSSRIKGSGTPCPSRTAWCPTNPASYDVTRSISPLTKKKPATHGLGKRGELHALLPERVDRSYDLVDRSLTAIEDRAQLHAAA